MLLTDRTGYPSVDRPWLKYYSEEQVNVKLPDGSMYDYMIKCASKSHAEYVINYLGKRVSYQVFIKKIELTVASLREFGIRQGDVVSVCVLSIPETYYLFYAINKIGAVANYVAVNDTAEEMRKKVLSVSSKIVFVVNLAEKTMAGAIVGEDIPIVSIPIYESMPFPISLIVKKKTKVQASGDSRVISWRKFIKTEKKTSEPTEIYQSEADTIALIEYTSGTTGESKGAVHNNLSANTIAFNYENLGWMMEHEPNDRFLNCIPPFLAYGIFVGVHMPICLGMEVVLCPNPDADEFVKIFKKYKPNHFAGGALHIDKMMADLQVQKMDLSFLRTAAFGGDTVTDVWIERVNSFLKSHGCKKYMARGYGMTEIAGTFATSNQSVQEMIPFPTNNVMIRDVDTNEELKIAQEGEIYITGPSLMREYYSKADETEEALLDINGTIWLKTGDLGYITQAGELVISGRLKRIYWTLAKDGVGYRVYPMKIERVIAKHNNVDSVAVVGVKHPERAYLSIAYLKLKDVQKKNSTISEIIEMCSKELNENSLPYRYRVINTLPTTKAGKIDYKMLEQMVTNIEIDE